MKRSIFECMWRGESVRKKGEKSHRFQGNSACSTCVLTGNTSTAQENMSLQLLMFSKWDWLQRHVHSSQHKLYCKLEMTGEKFHPIYSTLWEQLQSPGLP